MACELGHLVSPGPGAAQGCTGCCKRPSGWSALASSWPSGSRRGRLAHRSLLQAAGKGLDSGGLQRAQPEAGCPPGGKRPPGPTGLVPSRAEPARTRASVWSVRTPGPVLGSSSCPSGPARRGPCCHPPSLDRDSRLWIRSQKLGLSPESDCRVRENPGRLNGSSGGAAQGGCTGPTLGRTSTP